MVPRWCFVGNKGLVENRERTRNREIKLQFMSQIIKINLIQKIRMDFNLATLTNRLILVVLEDQNGFVHLGLE